MVTHRGDHVHSLVAGLAGVDEPLGDPLYPLVVSHRRATVLLHDQCHDGRLPSHAPTPPVVSLPGEVEPAALMGLSEPTGAPNPPGVAFPPSGPDQGRMARCAAVSCPCPCSRSRRSPPPPARARAAPRPTRPSRLRCRRSPRSTRTPSPRRSAR